MRLPVEISQRRQLNGDPKVRKKFAARVIDSGLYGLLSKVSLIALSQFPCGVGEASTVPVTRQVCWEESVGSKSTLLIEASSSFQKFTFRKASEVTLELLIRPDGTVQFFYDESVVQTNQVEAILVGMDNAFRSLENFQEYVNDSAKPVEFSRSPSVGVSPRIVAMVTLTSNVASKPGTPPGSISVPIRLTYPDSSEKHIIPQVGMVSTEFPMPWRFLVNGAAGEAEVSWWEKPYFPKSVIWKTADSNIKLLRKSLSCSAPQVVSVAAARPPVSRNNDQFRRLQQDQLNKSVSIHAASLLSEFILPKNTEKLRKLSKQTALRQVGYGAYALCSSINEYSEDDYWSLVDKRCVQDKFNRGNHHAFLERFSRRFSKNEPLKALLGRYSDRLQHLGYKWPRGIAEELSSHMGAYCLKASEKFLRNGAGQPVKYRNALVDDKVHMRSLDDIASACVGRDKLCKYFTEIRKKIEKNWTYPNSAKKNHVEGDVKVQFKLEKSGKISEAIITESSCSKILDEEILAAVNRSSPANEFPADFSEASIVVSGTFSFTLAK